MTASLPAQRRILRVALFAAAIEGSAVGSVERRAAAEALGKVGIGEKERRERYQIDNDLVQRRVGAGEVVALVAHQRPAPNSPEELDVGPLAGSDRIVRQRFDDVQ